MSAPHFDDAKEVLAPFRGTALPHTRAQRHRFILLIPGRRPSAGTPIGDPFIPIHGGLTISARAMIRAEGIVWADSPTVYLETSSRSYRGWHSIRSAREARDVWTSGTRLPPSPLPILT